MKKVNRALGDAGKLLTNMHHEISNSRYFIQGNLRGLAWEVAENSTIDSGLFGENLAEKYKSAQSLEKTSEDLIKQNISSNFGANSQKVRQQAKTSKPRWEGSRRGPHTVKGKSNLGTANQLLAKRLTTIAGINGK